MSPTLGMFNISINPVYFFKHFLGFQRISHKVFKGKPGVIVEIMSGETSNSAIDIGERLRTARTLRRLSQRELARRAGVTNGMISQIEQNHSSPSISSLKRILDAIPLSMAEFFADDFTEQNAVFFRKEDLREISPLNLITKSDDSTSPFSFRQVGDARNHTIQMLHERYAPGADTGPEMYSHNSEEAGIVIEGSIEVTVGERTETLHPGDAYLFDSRIPHRFRNTGSGVCIIVSACSPPSF